MRRTPIRCGTHLNANRPALGVELENQHGKWSLVAIQGPRSVAMLQPHVDVNLDELKYYFCTEGHVDGAPRYDRANRVHR